MGNDDNTDPYDGIDLGDYRYAVAGVIRLLICARLSQQPGFLDAEAKCRWDIDAVDDEQRPVQVLLKLAQAAHDHIDRFIIGPGISWSLHRDDPLSGFKEKVIHFLVTEPKELSATIAEGEIVNWDLAFPWDSLSEIRDGLDQLPHPNGGRPDDTLQYTVTLNQAAALVSKSTSTLRKYKNKGLPSPINPDAKTGQSLEYDWLEIKPFLEKTWPRVLPDIPPSYAASRIRRI